MPLPRPPLALLLPALLSAAPPPAPPLRLAILGDFNGPYGATTYPALLGRALAQVQAWRPDAVLSPGDLVAGQSPRLSAGEVRAMWAAFDREVRAPLAQAGLPFAFTLGNHDAALPGDRREAARYWQAHAPALAYVDRAGFPFRFAFTLGGGQVFVASLDASGPTVDAAQRRWLAAQLASGPARAAGVRLVLGHLPLAGVSADKNRPGEVIREAGALRQVMEDGNVLAYLHGHHAAFYPGRLGGLNVLSAGGIGGRAYVGFPGTARSTVTLLSVWPAQGRATFHTVDVATGKAIPTETLPARLEGLGGPLERVGRFEGGR
ncbi:metallophosphoesterase family protein [Deinococcus multiflagellatus]|uniref:metallophosphoesterase family protein n=1 Tax=Deinococcus multiflagellatus TaxID=1656887 RepID=UPI001CCEE908|nr:metallophosphoesterase [Deinococcus multiflagellatus]MBZ9714069.1 metallophosphoesterase [Deinococcus multiflagellatus]